MAVTDIVDRLRAMQHTPTVSNRAADEIVRLRNEVADLRALIDAYRKWASECPILETNKR